MPSQKWKITIEYDGTHFHGWQIQPNLPTIQGAIETAIYKFCGQNIEIQAAGRTDAGVHAHGQVAHFNLDYGDRALTGLDLAKAINAHLRPNPITIVNATPVDNEFHARFGATNKLYRYRIVTRRAPPVMDNSYVWHIKYDLNVNAMQLAANHLIGTHDFTSFRDAQCQANSPVRTLDRVDVSTRPYDNFGGQEIWIELEALSFIHHQCRNIAGTLMLVGRGKITPDDVKAILDARDRTQAGQTAPASGLSLRRIDY